jgi:WD40 repeat protein
MKNFTLRLAFFAVIFSTSAVTAQTIDWIEKANPLNQTINGVAFRADGQKVLSGTNCHPASIRMFDVSSAHMDWDYTVGSDFLCVMGVAFSSNSNYISAIEEFGNIFLFDNTGASPVIMDTIDTGTSYAFSTAISPNNQNVAVGCSDGKLKIYQISTGALLIDFAAHPFLVSSIAYTPNGNYIVSGGDDNKVKIWDTNGVLVHTLTGHGGDVTNVKVTPDGNHVVSASKDDKIKIWETATGTLVNTISGHKKDVNCLDVSPDGSKLVSASSDSTCKIWNFSTGSLLSTFGVADSGSVHSVAWSPNGDKIVTGNYVSDLILWSVPANLGVEELADEVRFELYPNPAKNSVKLSFTQSTSSSQVSIYSALGQKLTSFADLPQGGLTIDLSRFADGAYLVEWKDGSVTQVRKLMIQK